MIETGFDRRIKIQQIVQNQIPEFLLSESPKTEQFLKQYYISQEYQGGPVDIAENLDQYIKIDNLTPEIISGETKLSNTITTTSDVVTVTSTKGFPPQYGLLKIDNEIITYTGLTTNTFTGCVRGFSGITSYHQLNTQDELIFSTSSAGIHTSGATVRNLSSLFLQEFYNKIKYTFVPGLENVGFTPNLDVSNFIKEARSLYQSKGTEESFKILFKILYNENVEIIDLENLLIKPSASNFSRREVLIVERLSGDPLKLVGQTIKKSTDDKTQGSVSEVEFITRSGRTYYKISLFIGFNEKDLTEGTFNIQGNTKVLETVSVGSSIISVDSTIGFGQTGTLVSGSNIISYTDKSVNQFFGCSGVNNQISIASTIRSNEYVYGYEDGNLKKKVEMRITGVLSKFIPVGDINLSSENEIIGIKNVGESIKNPSSNKTYKEIFANSWIYNTSSRYQVSSISGSTFTLLSDIDKSSLKVGDVVDILLRGSQTIVASSVTVSNVNSSTKQVILSGLGTFTPSDSLSYDIRRKIEKSYSTGAKLQFGNNNLIANVQNVYTNQKYGYVASNSLPSYTITKNVSDASISEANGNRLQDLNVTTLKYSTISFSANVPFIDGDEVVYLPEKTAMPGLISGNTYYVQVLSSPNKIKLFSSRSFVGSSEYIEFGDLSSGTGSHRFLLKRHKDLVINPQKLLKKFPLSQNYSEGFGDKTETGPIGLLVNGVEVISPKSEDKIYFGPLNDIKVINSGSGYDVINPPQISITSPTSGTTALAKPVISGSVSSILVDPQDFSIETVVSASISGGNGNGAILQPIISKKYREIEFDARETIYGGGVDISNETISFSKFHNLTNGQTIIYNNNGNLSLGIGTFGPPDLSFNKVQNKTLVNGSNYYVQVVTTSAIKLYQTFNDYAVGLNTVGFTTENTSGIHKFRTLEKKTLRDIKVINPGSGYQNRQLYVKPSGISSERDCVIFKNHNFNDGDIIRYNVAAGAGTTTPTTISGLSTANSYYVLKIDNNSFRLANAGVGASITSNYERKNYVKISSIGSGYQIFKYPDIEINVNVSYGSSIVGVVTCTPVIKGKIIDAYLYEPGTGYGSNTINFIKKPTISIKNGKNAQVAPVIKNGRITAVRILSGGSEYYSIPVLKINGNGTGAILRPVISNAKLVDVVVINSGINYDSNTTINVVASGSEAKLDCSIRQLTVNEYYRFSYENLVDTEDNLKYSVVGYSVDNFATIFGDSGTTHSPIIGWAYDGNPIYGPYGYSNSEDIASPIKLIKTGYTLDTSKVENRPSSFGNGFFIEDYIFDDSGDLDIHNGRFCKTPEFPYGTYAYFVGVATDTTTNTLKPTYPYFIGDSYRSIVDKTNFTLNQKFDFNNSDLSRNTFPYKVAEKYADNDFLIESNEVVNQKTIIESVSKGSVDSFNIIESGEGYKIGDNLLFDDTGTNGGGLSVEISEIKGQTITNVSTQVDTYSNSVFVWKNKNTVEVTVPQYHTISDGEYVTISGLSSSITKLSKSHKVGVSTERIVLFKALSSVVPGTVEDIYVSNIPSSVSVGSTLKIEGEPLQVLNIFEDGSILRVRRSDTGVAHTASTFIEILPNKFEIPINVSYFDSQVNSKIYFNPKQSVGVGTTAGGSSSVSYTVGEVSKNISILNQSIYLPNHPFKTGQQVTLSKKSSSFSSLICSNTPGGSTFFVPDPGSSQTVYIINKSKDYIGITTSVGLTTNTNGLYFSSNGSDSYEYALESNLQQVKGTSQKIKSTVSVSTYHNLQTGDIITLNVTPNVASGIGNSSIVRVKYNEEYDRVLINPVGFSSAGINTSSSQITLDATYLNTGDKVFYSPSGTVATGLSTGMYFVYKIDNSTIKLTDTYFDTLSQYPNTISITGIGNSSHQISIVNPQIPVVRNSDLVFDTSDSSLLGKQLRIFYDSKCNNEFISTGSTSVFNVAGFGTVGLSTNATLTLKYSEGLPSKLYYALETSGYISTSDTEVKNASEISFVDSAYNGTYIISGIGSTSFTVSLDKNPEKNTLSPSENDSLEYYTTSKTANGGIKKLKTIFAGYNYKKLPRFVGTSSTIGQNANIIPQSSTIGKINKTRILNSGFEYSSDKTLRPEADISPVITINNSNTFSSVTVLDGGKNYSTPPNLIIVNPTTGKLVDSDSLTCNLSSSSISSVDIKIQPYGLSSIKQRIVAINNSNGVSISSIRSSPAGIITCVLATPIVGFSTNVFNVGEEIFVEGIQKEGTEGTGFNSADYGYRFFTVTSYQNTNPAIVEFNLAGIANNAGLAKTNQLSYATIVSKKNYPVFETNQDFALFNLEEKLLLNSNGTFVEKDIHIVETSNNYIKVSGTYELKIGDRIKGKISGVIASIEKIAANKGQFIIDYSTRQEYGWTDDVGKLSETYQVTSDNDYYQNLSYSVKSSIEYNNLINPVNRILHTTGLKNFADTQIISRVNKLVSYGATTNDYIVLDVTDEKRVDTINNFDLSLDVDTFDSKSKFLKFKNKKLTDYIKCISNRVLSVDDISKKFSNKESNSADYIEIEILEDTYAKYLVQIVNPINLDRQVSEIILLNDVQNTYALEKASLYNTLSPLGVLDGNSDGDIKTLRFTPTDPLTTDYDIKVVKSYFNSSNSGVGTQSIGFVDLIGCNKNVGVGTTVTLISIDKNKVEGLFANIQLTNSNNKKMQYLELFLTHDGTNTYQSDFYFDSTDIQGISTNSIGSFQPNINSGYLTLDYYNDTNDEVLVRTKIVGFGTTSVGVGTYRFLATSQPSGSERSARIQSNYGVSAASTSIIGIETSTVCSLKSLVKVSYGNTSALHQVFMLQDGNDVYTSQGPFLSIGSTSGIGTFGGTITGSGAFLEFYPDPSISSNIQIQSFNEIIYTESDFSNEPESLDYGTASEVVQLAAFDAINGNRFNKLDFDLTYQGYPIYKKTFNPSLSSVLNPVTGVFTVVNHFFSTGEELEYAAGSTFFGVTSSPVGIGSTADYVGVVTSILPSKVYAIKINNDQFKLSTRKEYASAGIYVTFTSTGSGNAHSLTMSKKLEKSIISLNGVVQKPITYVPISYTLSNNGGQIGAAATYFSLSGISTIRPKDLIKIDNEYIGVIGVGVGTSSTGPITGLGTFPVVEVVRGFVGSSATTHTDGVNAQLYRGAFNISGNKIYFTEAPKGNPSLGKQPSNLPYTRTTFSGRVYLRNDYTTNILYDDISDKFTGIGQTYSLTVQGVNTTGIQTGSGIVFLNDIFQTPSTSNNAGNNYDLSVVSGISSIRFTGITSSNGQIVISDEDVNQNQLPRGGIIVSLGSTSGAGFAPLVGAKVKAIVGAGGSITSITGIAFTGTGKNVSTAYYDNNTGIVEITTTTPHELSGGDLIKLIGLGFTCQSSSGVTSYFPLSGLSGSYGVSGIVSSTTFNAFVGYSTLPHTYVGMGTIFPWYNLNYGSGYRNPVSIAITDSNHTGTAANISAVVGAGGTLGFVINSGGSGYSTSTVLVNVSEPSYSNLSVIGVSRAGIGSTTETGKNLLISLDVGAISTTGIGSTLFEVSSFKISRPGYGFKIGDVFKPVGLVTAKGLSQPLTEFEITVLDTFTDSFSSWQFGELDYIDSIKNLQDGQRKRFPLYYNGQLLSFEKDPADPNSVNIDLDSVLLIFVNGVIQVPGTAYSFEGGTSFIFSDPPKPEDKIAIFFYRGTRNEDTVSVNISETVKIGDIVQVFKNNIYPSTLSQDSRRIDNIPGSDTIETNIYTGIGIDQTNYKPLSWTKQKVDRIINGDYVYKSRDSIESQIYPTSKIIKDIAATDNEIFVDDARFFNYEENNYSVSINTVEGLIVQGTDPVAAALTATVSVAGTISSLTVVNPGFGYTSSSASVKISAPKIVGVGVGTTATATLTIVGGVVTGATITNPGFGYVIAPQVIAEYPKIKTEKVTGITVVQGSSGIVTGITTSTGTAGNPLALKFFLNANNFTDLSVGYPIYIKDTTVGRGITSINSSDTSVVGFGTTNVDNVYIIHSLSIYGTNAEIVSNIKSNTDVVGIETTGTSSTPVGKFSWGRLSPIIRGSTPVAIGVSGLTVDSGLSTFPTIQRRGFGLRDTGAIRKQSNV